METSPPLENPALFKTSDFVRSEFERAQYAQQYQLSWGQQVAACAGRAWKLHVRDKDNYLMYDTGWLPVAV